MFVVLHNLLHLLLPTVENEFTFSQSRTLLFWRELIDFRFDFWKDVFSFLGWYGVSTFMFLTGYGLTIKYGSLNTDSQQSFKLFITKHFKKLFLLMFLPYIPFAILQLYKGNYIEIITQLTLVSNIFHPNSINPGVFWYFGLIFQFYILYALLMQIEGKAYRKTILLLFNIVSIFCLVLFSHDEPFVNWMRHNCIGWVLPFSIGVWFAEGFVASKYFDQSWENFIWIIIGSILLVLANLNYCTWLISPILSILIAIGFAKLMKWCLFFEKCFIWIGGLSAYMFAVHPLVRLACLKLFPNDMISSLYILGYLSVTVVVAMIYKKIHSVIFNRFI